MPLFSFFCPSCSGVCSFLTDGPNLCKQCHLPMVKQLPKARFFLPKRDSAVNHAENARYREWVNSPEVQEKLKTGEYIREGNNFDALTDELNCIEEGSS